MIRKTTGTILLGVGIFIALVLFTYGGPVFPHLIGPIVFVVVGAGLLLFRPKPDQQPGQ